VVLISDTTKSKAERASSFLHYEIETIARLGLPVVFVNLNGSRGIQTSKLPATLASPYYTVSVSFQPKIIKYALDGYVPAFLDKTKPRTGPHYYETPIYESLEL
jgi:hypothetical protein